MTKKTTKKIQNAPIPEEQQSPAPQVETPIEMPPEPEEAFLKKELPPELINEMPSAKSAKKPKPVPIIEVSPEPEQVLSPGKEPAQPAQLIEEQSSLQQEMVLSLVEVHLLFKEIREIRDEVFFIHKVLEEQSILLSEIQQTMAKKRNPPKSSDRVKILDKVTGITYKSKNNAYQTLLKAGKLKDLVEKGVFGSDPMKNTFGWYALEKAFPGRFEEVVERNPIDSLS
jgi:hypothetical protein